LKNNYNEAFIYNIYVQEINNIKNVKYFIKFLYYNIKI
jgi:hypothetical protein